MIGFFVFFRKKLTTIDCTAVSAQGAKINVAIKIGNRWLTVFVPDCMFSKGTNMIAMVRLGIISINKAFQIKFRGPWLVDFNILINTLSFLIFDNFILFPML